MRRYTSGEPNLLRDQKLYSKYVSSRMVQEPVNLEELATFVAELRPRCVHDLKPLGRAAVVQAAGWLKAPCWVVESAPQVSTLETSP